MKKVVEKTSVTKNKSGSKKEVKKVSKRVILKKKNTAIETATNEYLNNTIDIDKLEATKKYKIVAYNTKYSKELGSQFKTDKRAVRNYNMEYMFSEDCPTFEILAVRTTCITYRVIWNDGLASSILSIDIEKYKENDDCLYHNIEDIASGKLNRVVYVAGFTDIANYDKMQNKIKKAQDKCDSDLTKNGYKAVNN